MDFLFSKVAGIDAGIFKTFFLTYNNFLYAFFITAPSIRMKWPKVNGKLFSCKYCKCFYLFLKPFMIKINRLDIFKMITPMYKKELVCDKVI